MHWNVQLMLPLKKEFKILDCYFFSANQNFSKPKYLSHKPGLQWHHYTIPALRLFTLSTKHSTEDRKHTGRALILLFHPQSRWVQLSRREGRIWGIKNALQCLCLPPSLPQPGFPTLSFTQCSDSRRKIFQVVQCQHRANRDGGRARKLWVWLVDYSIHETEAQLSLR